MQVQPQRLTTSIIIVINPIEQPQHHIQHRSLEIIPIPLVSVAPEDPLLPLPDPFPRPRTMHWQRAHASRLPTLPRHRRWNQVVARLARIAVADAHRRRHARDRMNRTRHQPHLATPIPPLTRPRPMSDALSVRSLPHVFLLDRSYCVRKATVGQITFARSRCHLEWSDLLRTSTGKGRETLYIYVCLRYQGLPGRGHKDSHISEPPTSADSSQEYVDEDS